MKRKDISIIQQKIDKMKNIPYVSIPDPKGVLEKHPKFKEAFRKWQIDKAIQGGAPREIADAQITDYFLEMIVGIVPRTLFDWADDNNIYMTPVYDGENRWTYSINGNTSKEGGDNRKDIEVKGFLAVIQKFENQ